MGTKANPVAPMTVEAFVERFVGNPPLANAFASAMSRSLTPEEQLDVVIVTRETRSQCSSLASELGDLRARLDQAGANKELIARATAAYASQFLVGATPESEITTPTEQAALRVHDWIDTESKPRMTVDALVRRFEADKPFATLMADTLTGQERADIVLVSRHVRARRHRHQTDLEILGHKLRDAGANECAVYRIAALYSSQFPLADEIVSDTPEPVRESALRIWAWASQAPAPQRVQMVSATLQQRTPDQTRAGFRGLTS